jgi:hypothetical protein
MPMISSVQLLCKEQGCQGRSRRRQTADSKNCNDMLFAAMSIEGHYRVPSLVVHVLMRFDAFGLEVMK